MKTRLLPLLIASVLGLCAQVQAQVTREYYLVGLRHVYMFDVWPDPYKQDREAVEEDFAAAVDAAQQQFAGDMTSIRSEEAQDGGALHQADRDAVQQNLEQDIADAADKRDASLGQMYVECDYVRASHPEFQVDQDGPYQVIGVEVDPDGEFGDVCFYQPYPEYLDPCPFGWTWGHAYPIFSFGMQVRMLHSRWQMFGQPPFGTLYTHNNKIVFTGPVRMDVIMNRKTWVGGRPPAITGNDRAALAKRKELERKAGIIPPSTHPLNPNRRVVTATSAESKYSKPPSKQAQSPSARPTDSRYSHAPTHSQSGAGAGSSRTRTGGGGSESHGGGGSGSGGGSHQGDDRKKGG